MLRPRSFKVYRSWNEIEDRSFVDKWNGWLEQDPDPHVFYHPVLVMAWVNAYRKFADITPVFCVAEFDDCTVFLPLVLWNRNWKNAFLRMIVPVGLAEFDYHDPVVSGPHSTELLNSFWSVFQAWLSDSGSIRYDRLELPGFRTQPEGDGWMLSDEACPFVDLAAYTNYQDYLSKINKGLRQDIGRQKRRLIGMGQLTYRVYSPVEAEAALELLPEFLEVHSRKWIDGFKAPGFHEELLREGVPAGVVHFSVLLIDGKPISWHYGFRYRGRFYYYQPAYLETYATYSPSKVHLSCMKEECFLNGIRIFDYLRGAESYKSGWTTEVASLYDVTLNSRKVSNRLRQGAYDRIQEFKKMIGW